MIVYRDGDALWMCDVCFDVVRPKTDGWAEYVRSSRPPGLSSERGRVVVPAPILVHACPTDERTVWP